MVDLRFKLAAGCRLPEDRCQPDHGPVQRLLPRPASADEKPSSRAGGGDGPVEVKWHLTQLYQENAKDEASISISAMKMETTSAKFS